VNRHPNKKPVAFFAEVDGLSNACVCAGVTRGNARYKVYLSLQDANYDRSFQHIKVSRAQKYDPIAEKLAERHMCIDVQYADDLLRQWATTKGAL
jgi:hypothetical protein